MQTIELQNQLIEEIRQIPHEKMAEIYDLIHYFRLGFNQEKRTVPPKNQAQSRFLENYINNPIKLAQFTPLQRDSIYER